MNRSKAKELLEKYLSPTIEKIGFKSARAEKNDLNYRRVNDFGWDGYYCTTIDYNPIQISKDYYYKRINKVEEILTKIGNEINLSLTNHEERYTLSFGYRSLNNIRSSTYLPEMQKEEDVIRSTNLIKEFMVETAIPLLDRFNDIREIDGEINGDIPWESCWQKKINLANDFNFRRLIIARLANNPRYSELVEWTFQRFEKIAKEQGKEFPGRDNLEWPIAYTIHFLKDVEPIY